MTQIKISGSEISPKGKTENTKNSAIAPVGWVELQSGARTWNTISFDFRLAVLAHTLTPKLLTLIATLKP